MGGAYLAGVGDWCVAVHYRRFVKFFRSRLDCRHLLCEIPPLKCPPMSLFTLINSEDEPYRGDKYEIVFILRFE